MRKITLLLTLCLSLSSVNAINVFSPEAKVQTIELEELQRKELISFETRRDKDGAVITETWEGVSILSWLQNNGNWQNLKVQSKDGYSVNFNRLELSHSNLFLALKLNGSWLSEYDVRIIHTPSRENSWVRNLDFLKLEDYLPYPQPQRILLVQDWMKDNQALFSDDYASFAELLPTAFSLENVDLILVDKQNHRLRMNYPRDLAKARLYVGERGQMSLDMGKNKLPSFAGGLRYDQVVYLQAGPVALVSDECLPQLKNLAALLGWQWEGKSLEVVTNQAKIIPTHKLPAKLKPKTWLGLRSN